MFKTVWTVGSSKKTLVKNFLTPQLITGNSIHYFYQWRMQSKPLQLSDKRIQKLLPKDKRYLVGDGQSLYIRVCPNGTKHWQFHYSWLAKAYSLSFGLYPEVSIEDARELAFEARKLKRQGMNPGEHRKKQKALIKSFDANTFERMAWEWFEIHTANCSTSYIQSIRMHLEKYILSRIGTRPINNILTPDIVNLLRLVEKDRTINISHRVAQICSQIFQYGVVTGQTLTNPAQNLTTVLKKQKKNSHPYFTVSQLHQFLSDIEDVNEAEPSVFAVKLMLLTFVRTAELCDAKWSEIDFNFREWRIPAVRMKMKDTHVVPLSAQAIAVLRLQQQRSGDRGYIFKSIKSAHLPMRRDRMISKILYQLGYKGNATIHGIRATASTILNESNLFNPAAIERQLSHRERNRTKRAYDHSQHMEERKRMLQWWADYLSNAGLLIPPQLTEIKRENGSEKIDWLSWWTNLPAIMTQ